MQCVFLPKFSWRMFPPNISSFKLSRHVFLTWFFPPSFSQACSPLYISRPKVSRSNSLVYYHLLTFLGHVFLHEVFPPYSFPHDIIFPCSCSMYDFLRPKVYCPISPIQMFPTDFFVPCVFHPISPVACSLTDITSERFLPKFLDEYCMPCSVPWTISCDRKFSTQFLTHKFSHPISPSTCSHLYFSRPKFSCSVSHAWKFPTQIPFPDITPLNFRCHVFP